MRKFIGICVAVGKIAFSRQHGDGSKCIQRDRNHVPLLRNDHIWQRILLPFKNESIGATARKCHFRNGINSPPCSFLSSIDHQPQNGSLVRIKSVFENKMVEVFFFNKESVISSHRLAS